MALEEPVVVLTISRSAGGSPFSRDVPLIQAGTGMLR